MKWISIATVLLVLVSVESTAQITIKSEYIAVLSCLAWIYLWMMIVANDVIYQKIVTPVWVAMLILTFVYFVFCVQKSLVFDEKILEDYTYEIRI